MNGAVPQPIDPLAGIQRWALYVGLLASALCLFGAVANTGQFFRSYLVAYLLWSGVTLGCLAVVMLHHLVGGGWGYLIRRPMEAVIGTWPLLVVFLIPVLAGINSLYGWAQPDTVLASDTLQHQRPYLNVPFFLSRMAIFLAVWALLSHCLVKWSNAQDDSADPSWLRRLRNLSGPGLVVYWITVSFACVDLVMSLEVGWFSTIFSALFIIGQGLSSVAFATAILYLVAARAPLSDLAVPKYVGDLGNIMLMLVMLWAYMQFGQLLIVWSGNLTDEISWYMHRVSGGWAGVSWLLFLGHFVLPFALLLSRAVKRNLRNLSLLAVAIVAVRLLDTIWLVEPSFDSERMTFHWMDWVAPVALGGFWVAASLWQLRRRPMLPLRDPRLPLVIERIARSRVGDV